MQKFYTPILNIIEYYEKRYNGKRVLDVGPGVVPLSFATDYVDIKDWRENNSNLTKQDVENLNNIYKNKNIVFVNVCKEKLPFKDKEFDFVYARHILEDLPDPVLLFNEMKRIGKNGYIECPSMFAELATNVQIDKLRGYPHHVSFVWTMDNILNFAPKYSFIQLISGKDFPDKFSELNHPLFWNTYFEWKEGEKEPEIQVHYNELDYTMGNFHVFLAKKIAISKNSIIDYGKRYEMVKVR